MSDSTERTDVGDTDASGVGPGGAAAGGGGPGSPAEIPWAQRLYDNAFFWLFAGIVVMAIVYTGWGLLEIVSLPPAPLP